MTKLKLLGPDAALQVLHAAVGAAPSDLATIADLVRSEVSARSMCQRSTTIRRVQRMVAPIASIDDGAVANVCNLLERGGDVVVASGGVLFSTPLRAVDLGNGVFRMVSSLPTRHLCACVEGTWTVTGVTRDCRFDNSEQARVAIVAAGGIVVSPAGWTCLDRVPCADQTWLDLLDRRLRTEYELPGSLEHNERLSWQGCVAAEDGFHWASAEASKEARLWRACNTWRHWQFAWTLKGTPRESSFISLRCDEGTRSAFAVARILSSPVAISIKRHETGTNILIPTWLPNAEYRYLAVSSSQSRFENGATQWELPNNRLDDVLEVLQKRLGLVVRNEEPR